MHNHIRSRNPSRRATPCLEFLEDRRLLSGTNLVPAVPLPNAGPTPAGEQRLDAIRDQLHANLSRFHTATTANTSTGLSAVSSPTATTLANLAGNRLTELVLGKLANLLQGIVSSALTPGGATAPQPKAPAGSSSSHDSVRPENLLHKVAHYIQNHKPNPAQTPRVDVRPPTVVLAPLPERVPDNSGRAADRGPRPVDPASAADLEKKREVVLAANEPEAEKLVQPSGPGATPAPGPGRDVQPIWAARPKNAGPEGDEPATNYSRMLGGVLVSQADLLAAAETAAGEAVLDAWNLVPQGADLLCDFLPVDRAALDRAFDQLFAQADDLGRSLGAMETSAWVVLVGSVTVGCEAGRRRLRGRRKPGFGTAEDITWTGSDGRPRPRTALPM